MREQITRKLKVDTREVPLPQAKAISGQGLTLVYFTAQLEQLHDTFMSQVGLHGGQKSSS